MKQLFDKHFNMGVINVPYCLQPVASVNLAQVQSEVYALASVFIPLTLFSLRHSVNRLIFFPRSSVGSHALDPFWTISPTSHFSLFLLFPLPPSKRKVVSKLYFFIPVSFLLLYRCKSSFYSLARSSRGLIQRIPINIRGHETFMLSVYLCWGYFMCVCLYFKGCFLLM